MAGQFTRFLLANAHAITGLEPSVDIGVETEGELNMGAEQVDSRVLKYRLPRTSLF